MRRFLSFKFAGLACAILCGLTVFTDVGRANDAELSAIQARAQEIAPLLTSAPNFGARDVDPEYWAKLAATPTGRRAIDAAAKQLDAPFPKIDRELYFEFYRNGARSPYQSAFSRAQSFFRTFALAEALERKGRFVDALDKSINFFCDLPSWVLPAHDYDGTVYDGKALYSDLGSTTAAGELAIAINLHENALPRETVERAKREIERRVLGVYEEAVATDKPQKGMWWVRTQNNWNAVCCAGTVAAALNIVESPERRAFFIAASEFFSERDFLAGFTDDGYCSEGLGYWNYGFGNYIELGALVRVATKGKVDFFRFDKIKRVLDYAPNLEIDKENYAVFADCAMNARPSALYVGYLSRLKGYGYLDFEARGLGDAFALGGLIQTTSFGYDREIVFADAKGTSEKYAPPIRTEFPDAGVWICRPSADASGKYFAIAFKGGHNAELHNHNDVGSYSLLLGSNATEGAPDFYVSRDPGGETYTARTFSSRRYEGQLLNSFGHPVPRIAETLQASGAKSRGVVTKKEFSDARDYVEIDLTSAYPVATLKAATRSFAFDRATGENPGKVEIVDSVEFKEGATGKFETALITFEKDVQFDESPAEELTIQIGGAKVFVSARDFSGAPLKLVASRQIVGETDASVPNKPTRIALTVVGDVANARIVQRFEAR